MSCGDKGKAFSQPRGSEPTQTKKQISATNGDKRRKGHNIMWQGQNGPTTGIAVGTDDVEVGKGTHVWLWRVFGSQESPLKFVPPFLDSLSLGIVGKSR